MSSYGPMQPADFNGEPPECSTVVAADGTGTYRRALYGAWQQCGVTPDPSYPASSPVLYDWTQVQQRLEGVPCWVLTPDVPAAAGDPRGTDDE